MKHIKNYLPLLFGFLLSVVFGGTAIFFLVMSSNDTIAYSEDQFDPKILYSAWNDKDPWAPCGEYVSTKNFDDTLKAKAVECVAKRDATLKLRRDFYMDDNGGFWKSVNCQEDCQNKCKLAASAIGGYADCENGYISHPSEIEQTMMDCKAVCSQAYRDGENALLYPKDVLEDCCLALKNEIPEEVDEGDCFDGVQNGDEEGEDCGGECDTPCESVTIEVHPKEVEMVADGKTEMEFTVTVKKLGKPLAGEKLDYRLVDTANTIKNEGTVIPEDLETDAKGQMKFIYKTEEQPRDYVTSTLLFQVVHEQANPQARIILTPGFSIWCGNWTCQTGETNKNCPEDCPRKITKEQAWDIIVQKYKEVPLNPYAIKGVWCASCATNNKVLKAIAIQSFSKDKEKLAMAKRLREQYEPWVCGSMQKRVINKLDGLRLSKDATEREVIKKYYDYGPIEVSAIAGLNPLWGHLAVAVYPKQYLWKDSAIIFDPWLRAEHGMYDITQWEDDVNGQAVGFLCDPPFYPLCGGTYERVQRPELALTQAEKNYYNDLDQKTKDRINVSIAERAYQDVREAQKKFMIQRMMEFDLREKTRIIVNCPFNVMVTNKDTGERVGYDAEGNLILEDKAVYPEIRHFADNEIQSYFIVPKDGEYEITAAGIDDGEATVMTSYPNDNGEFEIYEYDDINVKKGSVLSLAVSLDNKKSALDIDGTKIAPVLKEVAVSTGSLDEIVEIAEGLYPEENQPGLGGEVFPDEYPPLHFVPVFDVWSVLMLLFALGLFVIGVVMVIKLRRKGKKGLGIVVLVLTWVAGILFLLIVAGRYVGEPEEIGSDYRVTNQDSTEDVESVVKTPAVKTVEEEKKAEEKVEEISLSYKNDEFGYELTMPPRWNGYMAETLPIDGENAVSVTQFYLPTNEDSEYSDKDGWFKMMIITAYPLDAWNLERSECEELDLCWEEEVGRDANFVYAWSYFNGIQPDDIPEEAIMDMEQIIESFVPATIAPAMVWDEHTIMQGYQNCTYGYRMIYPKHWMEVTEDTAAQNASFKGDGITISISAFDDGLTLDDFALVRTAVWSTLPVSSRDQERNGKRLIAYEYENPEAVYIFWEDGEYNLEMAVTGKDLEEFINGTGFFADFNHNIDREVNCK
jgi:hypothetical protein